MKAVIMAGGEGTRLRPLTCDLPKPMVPVLNRPVMEHIVNLLKQHGITDIAATLAYLPEKISSYFGTGEEFNVNMHYFIEEKPLGTAGSVKNAQSFLDDDFLVISGDALTDIDLSQAIAFHKKVGSMATLVLKRVDVPLEYGVVVTAKDGHIVQFLEKPSWGEVISDTVNTGIYILSPKVFSYYNENEKCDFAQDVFPKLLADKQPMYGYITDGYWCDIGDINAYAAANRDALNGVVKVEMPGFEFFKGVWLGKDCQIDEQVILSPRCIIGDGCIIRTGAHISENTIIGDRVTVGEYATIKTSVLWNGVHIGSRAELRGSLICENTIVDKRTRVFESAIIGSECKLGADTSVKPNVKIWPGKQIEGGTEISDNIVWNTANSFHKKSLFGQRGITGACGTEINPALTGRLGSAFAASLKPSAVLSVAHDGKPLSEMAALAFISGAAAAGAACVSCGALTLPILRFAVKEYAHQGAAFFRTEDDKMSIVLLDANGCDLTRKQERSVAGYFQKYDTPYAGTDILKPILTLENLRDHYIASFSKRKAATEPKMTIALSGDPYICRLAEEIFQRKGLQLCNLSAESYDLAITFAPDGENFDLYDERGVLLKGDLLSIVVSIVLFESYEKCTLAIPVNHSSFYEDLAKKYEAELMRTKVSVRDIMERISNEIIKESADAQISMRYDAVYCIYQIIEYLQRTGQTLSALKGQIPKLYMESEDIECTFDRKGTVMRKLIEENEGKAYETIDGIKIYTEKGWTLILPDSDRPIFRITTEGMNEEYAKELLVDYKEKIQGYLQ